MHVIGKHDPVQPPDAEAWRHLARKMFSFFRATESHEQAGDMTQETLLRVWTKLESERFNHGQAKLSTYAFGIAINVRREHRRGSRRYTSKLVALTLDGRIRVAHENQLEANLLLREQNSQLRVAIRQLAIQEQEVLALLVDRDLGLGEISEILRIPIGTVKSHVSRAKQKLKEILHTQEETNHG